MAEVELGCDPEHGCTYGPAILEGLNTHTHAHAHTCTQIVCNAYRIGKHFINKTKTLGPQRRRLINFTT